MAATPSSEHRPIDSRVHRAVLAAIVASGRAPDVAELASTLGVPAAEARAALRRLAENHGLVLHPASDRVWMAHPFALSPTGVWVEGRERGWWAACPWCALGIAALVGDVTIHARLGGEAQEVRIVVRDGAARPDELLVHFALPPRRAWENVLHYCATVLPFRSEAAIDAWCARHGQPRGAAVPLATVQRLARAWYGGHLAEDWRKWTAAQARTIFEQVGLVGPFWALEAESGRF